MICGFTKHCDQHFQFGLLLLSCYKSQNKSNKCLRSYSGKRFPSFPMQPPFQVKIPVVSLHCPVKLVSNHFHTGEAKPKTIFSPTTTAAKAAHREVYFTGAEQFSEKSNKKNILHPMPNCAYPHVYESWCPAGLNFTTLQHAHKNATRSC